eukprot:TRINITY_DN6380_c0_g1_i1.p1 TRINITY_DN6380_c0_g1~~TRINITY_DN6380_c0_g1_i1.p1  ORF type:complete len:299 (+),score=112.43 TRINITY_DN6380_c0_g1_i1:123-899(+)
MGLPYPFDDSEDAGHLFAALPGLIYASLLYVDASEVFAKKLLRPWMEPVVVFLLGVGVAVGEGGALINCLHHHGKRKEMCIEKNQMHVIFGVIVMEFGLLHGLFLLQYLRKQFNFVIGALFVVVGIFMLMHHQDSDFLNFMHAAYGYVTVVGGVFIGLAQAHKSLVPFAASLIMLGSVFLIFSGHSPVLYFGKHYGQANTAFLVVALAYGYFTLLTLAICAYAFWKSRRRAGPGGVHALLSEQGTEMEPVGDIGDKQS